MTLCPELISYTSALRILRESGASWPRRNERVSLEKAAQRVLADDILSPEELPSVSCSAMDGFAVNSKKADSGASKKILGTLAAGDVFRPSDARDGAETGAGAWEIMTGAVLPPGCDSVVKVEDCEREGDRVRFRAEPAPGRNVRATGEDFVRGQRVLARGHVLRPEDLLALAALGVGEAPVVARPRIGLLATGKELVERPGTPVPGQVRDSTSVLLKTAFPALACDAVPLGVVRDDPERFMELLRGTRTSDLDLIVSTGAVSVGRHDFVRASLEALGARILFHNVRVRPAKPILFAELPRAGGPLLYLGLPGQPVSSLAGLRFFIRPLLEAMRGQAAEAPLLLPLAEDIGKAEGLVSFLRAAVVRDSGGRRRAVRPHPRQQPSLLSPLLECDAWIRLDEQGDRVRAGEPVEVFQF